VARDEPQWLAAGRVGRPHGLDGSFHVIRPRGPLLTLGTPVRVGDLETRIVRSAGTAARPIVRLAGHESREAAQALRGHELRVHRAEAPPLDEDEWYAEDLEGCVVVDGDVVVGSVRRLLALPSCEVLEVERPGADSLLVPLVRDAVRSVDVEAGQIEVDLRFLGEEPGAMPDPGALPRGDEEPARDPSGAGHDPHGEEEPARDPSGAGHDPRGEEEPARDPTAADHDPRGEEEPARDPTAADHDPRGEEEPARDPPGAGHDPAGPKASR
jgi:16S rRNA processing protein RimM